MGDLIQRWGALAGALVALVTFAGWAWSRVVGPWVARPIVRRLRAELAEEVARGVIPLAARVGRSERRLDAHERWLERLTVTTYRATREALTDDRHDRHDDARGPDRRGPR